MSDVGKIVTLMQTVCGALSYAPRTDAEIKTSGDMWKFALKDFQGTEAVTPEEGQAFCSYWLLVSQKFPQPSDFLTWLESHRRRTWVNVSRDLGVTDSGVRMIALKRCPPSLALEAANQLESLESLPALPEPEVKDREAAEAFLRRVR